MNNLGGLINLPKEGLLRESDLIKIKNVSDILHSEKDLREVLGERSYVKFIEKLVEKLNILNRNNATSQTKLKFLEIAIHYSLFSYMCENLFAIFSGKEISGELLNELGFDNKEGEGIEVPGITEDNKSTFYTIYFYSIGNIKLYFVKTDNDLFKIVNI